ncbi:AFL222Wp [Eremothecium gossypii ATCC 10895]|uniref:AFL222Wp n=1 Tax=Eremothecium gossypii (strain ATCC 10895 / CBS 109.51 / FGSC 9923 / NRRL Y-1056) TaxID=284811 RepID=Q755N5_EREGS|nr:AFL222Wp [Eremothecium gossypii ATCC 10895]AAS53152.1 AFL222Wp [Eremothecium gossypii ATCC 10895]
MSAVAGAAYLLFKSISGFQFPYAQDERAVQQTPLWDVYQGTRKADSQAVTLFVHSRQKKASDAGIEQLVRNAVRKAKTLKLPGLVRVLEVLDTDPNVVYIVTERVQPLFPELAGAVGELSLGLGLSQVFGALRILEENAHVTLGTLSRGSVYVNERGEWCLFGLELCSAQTELAHLREHAARYRSLMAHTMFEVPATESAQVDSVLLAGLIRSVYTTGVPRAWQAAVSMLAAGRLTVTQFVARVSGTPQLQTPLITIYSHLKELHIKDSQDKLVALAEVQNIILQEPGVLDNSTPGFVDGFIIPQLSETIRNEIVTNQQQIAGMQVFSNIVSLLATALQLTCSKNPNSTSAETFKSHIKPLIFETFKISDRQVRFLLLMYMSVYVDKLSGYEIQNQVFPYFVQGLADSDNALRLHTLKNIVHIVEKITERQLNSDLLRQLAKTQVDSDVNIRTWTILTITSLAEKLSAGSDRPSLLGTAFTKSLKDPAVMPRLAALHGLAKSIHLFDAKTIANRILTVIAPGLLDSNAQVRSQAKELFSMYLKKLEDESSTADYQSDSEDYVDVDFESMQAEASQDEFISNFLSNLKVTADHSITNAPMSIGSQEKIDSDAWDTGDDFSWGDVDANEQQQPMRQASKPRISAQPRKPAGVKVNGLRMDSLDIRDSSQIKFGAVKTQNSWDNSPKHQITSHKSHSTPNLPSKLVAQQRNPPKRDPIASLVPSAEDDDGWDEEW